MQQLVYVRVRHVPQVSQACGSPSCIPRFSALAVKLSEWTVSLCQNAFFGHSTRETSCLLGRQHCRTDAEPAAQRDCALKLTWTTREPVQNRRASALTSFQSIKYRRSGAATVYRQNFSACSLAGPQYVVEHCQLRLPMLFVFWSTIKADFANVHRLRQVFVKQVQLAKTQVRKLWMESQRCPNPRASLNECGRSFPCAWGRCNG